MMIFAPSEAALEAAASPERQEPTPRMREHSAAWGSRAAAHGVTGAIFHHRAMEHTQHCRLRVGDSATTSIVISFRDDIECKSRIQRAF